MGQDRAVAELHPGDLMVVRRGAALAQEVGLPLVTVVDTAGGALSPEAEEGGLAHQIAGCLYDLAGTTVPTLCVLLGQGTGGAALALTTADRVLATRHAWLSPLPPEGASVIVHRDVEHAAQMAAQQRVACADLLRDGVVDRVVAVAGRGLLVDRADLAEDVRAVLGLAVLGLARAVVRGETRDGQAGAGGAEEHAEDEGADDQDA